jgi:hypothetical protein
MEMPAVEAPELEQLAVAVTVSGTAPVVGKAVNEHAAWTPAVTDTTAVADFVGSARLVAVTVALVLLVTLGAVYIPELEIVPAVAVHFTPVVVVLDTTA